MSDSFTIQFSYRDIVYEVFCTLRVSTYTYQFLCRLGDSDLILEKDDEGNLRAIEADPFSGKNKKVDPGIIRALVEELDKTINA